MKLNFLLCFIILIAALYVSETYKSETYEGFEENKWITMLKYLLSIITGVLIGCVILYGIEHYYDLKKLKNARDAARATTMVANAKTKP